MNSIILVGGFGTRLQSVSKNTPKALMPIGKKVLLDLLIERLLKFDVNQIYLSLHYNPEFFLDYLKGFKLENFITPIIESEPQGTGGAINYIIKNSSITSPFFVINGDSLSDINLAQMAAEFDTSNLKAMIGISGVEKVTRYSTVIEQDGLVLSFKEKGITGAGWINNGHYIFKKEAFDGFSGAFSLEKTLFPRLVQNQELGSFKVTNDNFIDMGIPEDYEKLCKMNDEK
jgi:D-glycero-alpha-D-manno-heptose 1-phosphate guanylyltransferase